jgi:hypothetical protein
MLNEFLVFVMRATDRVGVAAALCLRLYSKFVSSNLDREPGNPDEIFRGFPQSFQIIFNSLFISPNIRRYVLYIQTVPGGEVNIL